MCYRFSSIYPLVSRKRGSFLSGIIELDINTKAEKCKINISNKWEGKIVPSADYLFYLFRFVPGLDDFLLVHHVPICCLGLGMVLDADG